MPGAFQIYKNGPWRIPPKAIEHIEERGLNLNITLWDRVISIIISNKTISFITFFISVFALFFAAVSAGADIGNARQQLTNWGFFPAYRSAEENEVLIIVASFYNSQGTPDHNIQSQIKRQIINQSQRLGIENIRVEIEPRKIKEDDREKTIKIGNRYNSTMIIWGEYSEIEAVVSYQVLKWSILPTASGQIQESTRSILNDPHGYHNFVTRDLPAHLSFLGLFANGQALAVKGLKDEGISVIEQAIAMLEKDNPNIDSVASIYLTLASLYITSETIFYDHTKPIEYPRNLTSDELASYTSLLDNSRDDLMKSLEYYSEIINLGPNIYTENGFAYHNRAYLWGIVGEWDNCISDFIVFYEHIGKENDVAQATSYYMAGVLQQIIEGPEKAIDYFYKSVTLGRVEDCEFYTDLTRALC